MTNTQNPQAAAGWYPVSPGSTQLRWWDGTAWTDHLYETAVVASAPATLQAPEGTRVTTIWGWLAGATSILTLLTLIPVFFWLQGFFATADFTDPQAMVAAETSPAFLIPSLLSWVVLALFVLFCALDWLALRRAGVPAPFHWAWAFFAIASAQLVYLIGRGVVIRRRTGRGGLGPMWLWVAVTVATVIVVIVVIVVLVASVASGFSDNLNTSGGIA